MAWEVTADVERFAEAVDWFRSRIPTRANKVDLRDDVERKRAFRIAGETELGVVRTIHEEILDAIEKGTPLEEFKRNVRDRLAGWEDQGYRLETIFRTNVQTAYNTGRWYQLTDLEVTSTRPYLMYDAVLDTRTTEVCRGLDGTIKQHDDPFVLEHWCPLHHRCRSSWRSLRPSQMRKLGGVTPSGAPNEHKPDEGFGLAPPLRGDDWPPGPDREKTHPDLLRVFDARQAEFDSVSAEKAAREEQERNR